MSSNRVLFISGATLIAVVLSVLSITPRLLPWADNPFFFETAKVPAMTEQLADPAGWERSHLNDPDFNAVQSIRWRLLPPALGNALRLSPPVYLTLPWLGLLILVALSVHYSLRCGAAPIHSLAVGVLVGTSSAFFSASCAVGYFDPFYLIALLVACYTPSNIVFLGCCLLGPWVDEKFLLMLPLCCVVRWTWKPETRWLWHAAIGIAPYCVVRFVALALGDSSVNRQMGLQGAVFLDYAPALPEGWWYGFRLGWVLIFVGLWSASRRLSPYGRGLLVASLVGAVGSVSFLAWDTTRSIAMVLPLMLLGLNSEVAKKALPWIAGVNLLLPAAYVWCGVPVTVPLTSVFR